MHASRSGLNCKIPFRAAVFVSFTAIGLASCGSGTESNVGVPADNVSSEQLKRSAAANSGNSVGTTLSSVLQTMGNSTAITSAMTVPGLGLTAAEPAGALSDDSSRQPLFDDSISDSFNDSTTSLLDATMGLSGNSSTVREGNTLTIDPDERAICESQSGMSGTTTELNRCISLLADLTVRMDAATDQVGTIHYLFRNQSVLVIDYAPRSGSFEIKLGALKRLLDRNAELDPDADPVPDTMEGSLRVSSLVISDAVNAEAGTITVSVPEALRITDAIEEIDVSVQPSTLMSLTANAGTGTASLEIDIDSLQLVSRHEEIQSRPLQKLAMAGFTLRADLTRNGRVLTVSNLGLGNGPLTLEVDSLEVVRATLDNFGFTISEDSNQVTLDQDLNYTVVMANALGALDQYSSHDSRADISVSAPAGTVLSEVSADIMKVVTGGPVNVVFDVSDGSSQASGSVNINAGECFRDSDSETDGPIDNAACL